MTESTRINPLKQLSAVAVGMGTYKGVYKAFKKPSRAVYLSMGKVGQSLTDDEFTLVKEASKKVLDKSGLSSIGGEIIRVGEDNQEYARTTIAKGIFKKIGKFLPKPVSENYAVQISTDFCMTAKNNKNSYFISEGNKIITGKGKDMSLSTFHEIGHGVNYNFSKVGKILQNMRLTKVLPPAIALLAIMHNDKFDKNGKQSKLNKAGGFIKDNALALGALSFVPLFIEEALASKKGIDMAKEFLNPSLIKKANQTALIGLASYGVIALASLTALKSAIYVSDKMKA